jgi:hypothetical protein
MKRFSSATGRLLLVALAVSSGCESRTQQRVPVPREAWQTLDHEVGEVTAGIEISHTFVLANNLASPLHVLRDADVASNCGCATITTAARELAPGATTDVTVKVATRDRKGPFRLGGRIVWTDARNEPHLAVFALVGVARPPLALQPDELVFERDEVAKGRSKELKVIVDSAVDEASLTVEAPTGALAVEPIRSEKGHRVYAVKCLQPPRGEDEEFHAIVLAAKLTPRLGGIPVSAKVVVQVREAVPLDVQPKSLELRLDPDGRAVGKFVLSGEAMQGGDNVESLSCADYEVEWKATHTRPESPTAVVEITLLAPPDKNGPEKTTVRVKVKGLPALHVPVLVRK